jgi:hypothetical protein
MTESTVKPGDRVAYTALYEKGEGTEHRTEHGRVTSVVEPGPCARVRICRDTLPYPNAARYIVRYVADIEPEALEKVREHNQRQAARTLGVPVSTGALADALAGVDVTMGTDANPYGDPARELAALRDLAEAVRLYLLARPRRPSQKRSTTGTRASS